MTYRSDIDGLRALAVMSVVLCHVGLGFPGGYVGVDVFFVISGYLITRLMLKEIEAGSFSLVDFWQRRIRRIMPALIVVMLGAFAAGWLLLIPTEMKSLGRSIVAATTMQANVHFSKQVDYFAAAAEDKPLLHLWSLAVEEQFYLVVPLIVWATLRVRGRRLLIATVALLTASSFIVSLHGTAKADLTTYYRLGPRAWELFIGVATALVAGRVRISGRITREFAALIGLAGIAVPSLLYSRTTLFPGLAAIPPVLGTAVLIHLGDSNASPTLLHRLLARRSMVAVGLISYSLYLWHWPLLVYLKRYNVFHRLDLELTTGERIGIVTGAAVLATLSYRFVERPFRRRDFFASRRLVFGGAATAFGCLLACGYTAKKSEGFPNRLPEQVRNLAATIQVDHRFIREMTSEDVPGDLIHVGDKNATPRFFVWGDSHGMVALPAIHRLCEEAGLGGTAAVHSGWPPVLSSDASEKKTQQQEFAQAVVEHLAVGNYESVLLVGYWDMYHDAHFARPLLATIDRLQASGLRVYFLKTVPTFPCSVPDAVLRRLWSGGDLSDLAVTPDRYEMQNPLNAELLPQLAARGVVLLDSFPTLQRHFGTRDVLPLDDRGLLYRDTNHMTTLGAEAIMPTFAPLIADIRQKESGLPSTARVNVRSDRALK